MRWRIDELPPLLASPAGGVKARPDHPIYGYASVGPSRWDSYEIFLAGFAFAGAIPDRAGQINFCSSMDAMANDHHVCFQCSGHYSAHKKGDMAQMFAAIGRASVLGKIANIYPPQSPTRMTNNSILKLPGAFHCRSAD